MILPGIGMTLVLESGEFCQPVLQRTGMFDEDVGYRVCEEGLVVEYLQGTADALQLLHVVFERSQLGGCKLQSHGCQEQLRDGGARLQCCYHALQEDTFVCGMLVDEVHAVWSFGDDVALRELAEDTQGWKTTGFGCVLLVDDGGGIYRPGIR